MSKKLSEQVARLERQVERLDNLIVWLDTERERLAEQNADLREELERSASDHRKVNKWDGLCADVGMDPDSTISTVREAIERDAECGIQYRGEDLAKWLKECDERISKLAATTARPRHKLYDHAVLPDGRVVPYEEAKHIKDGDTPPRLTVHKLNVAPVGSRVTGGRTGYLKKYPNAWISEAGFRWSSEDIVSKDPDATLHLPEGQR